jgi:hypothetical protein
MRQFDRVILTTGEKECATSGCARNVYDEKGRALLFNIFDCRSVKKFAAPVIARASMCSLVMAATNQRVLS